jgi:hypothetical protein
MLAQELPVWQAPFRIQTGVPTIPPDTKDSPAPNCNYSRELYSCFLSKRRPKAYTTNKNRRWFVWNTFLHSPTYVFHKKAKYLFFFKIAHKFCLSLG